eukprot:Opistho-2@21360
MLLMTAVATRYHFLRTESTQVVVVTRRLQFRRWNLFAGVRRVTATVPTVDRMQIGRALTLGARFVSSAPASTAVSASTYRRYDPSPWTGGGPNGFNRCSRTATFLSTKPTSARLRMAPNRMHSQTERLARHSFGKNTSTLPSCRTKTARRLCWNGSACKQRHRRLRTKQRKRRPRTLRRRRPTWKQHARPRQRQPLSGRRKAACRTCRRRQHKPCRRGSHSVKGCAHATQVAMERIRLAGMGSRRMERWRRRQCRRRVAWVGLRPDTDSMPVSRVTGRGERVFSLALRSRLVTRIVPWSILQRTRAWRGLGRNSCSWTCLRRLPPSCRPPTAHFSTLGAANSTQITMRLSLTLLLYFAM